MKGSMEMARLSETDLRDMRGTSKLQPIDTPPILYKYRSLDSKGHYLKLIQDGELWFSSARKFNDPFDCALQYQFKDNPPGIKAKWANNVLRREAPDLNREQRRKFVNKRLKEIKKDDKYIEKQKQYFVELNYKKYGICSLTSINNDLLMWAHYADHHRGFCIGIDTEELLKFQLSLPPETNYIELVKVDYSSTMPCINFFETMLRENHTYTTTLLTTKSKHWYYEHEFRLMYYNHVDTSMNIGHSAIVEVVLGCKVDDKNKEDILAVLNKEPSPTAVFQARKNKRNFALDFERIR